MVKQVLDPKYPSGNPGRAWHDMWCEVWPYKWKDITAAVQHRLYVFRTEKQFVQLLREAAKKSYLPNGRAIKRRGEGGSAGKCRPLKKKIFTLKNKCCHLKIKLLYFRQLIEKSRGKKKIGDKIFFCQNPFPAILWLKRRKTREKVLWPLSLRGGGGKTSMARPFREELFFEAWEHFARYNSIMKIRG